MTQVEYGWSRGEMLLHWFKLCIHDLTRTLFQLESVTLHNATDVIYNILPEHILGCYVHIVHRVAAIVILL